MNQVFVVGWEEDFVVDPAEGQDAVKDDNKKIISVIKYIICSTCNYSVRKIVCSKQTSNEYYLSNRDKWGTVDFPTKYN